MFSPLSTGITYALIERAPADHIPVVSMGYGRSDAADGRVFSWVFPILGTYWMQADTLIQYVALQEGGYDKLKGKKIALVYHELPYGKEPIPVFQALAKQYGFDFEGYPGNRSRLLCRGTRPSSVFEIGTTPHRPRAGRASLSKILVCPADDTRSVASIETSMPPFTEATTTLCARALGLDATSEYVFAHPAIYPFTLFNQAFSASGTLGGVGRV